MGEITKPLTQIETEINILKTQTAQNIIEIGKRLIEAKNQLPHGEWGKWLEEKVEFKRETARKFMLAAEQFGNYQALGNLNQTKIFALLDVPAKEREQFVQQNPVEDMTTRQLQQAIKEIKEKKQTIELLQKENEELKNQEPKVITKEVMTLPKEYHKMRRKLLDNELEIERLTVERDMQAREAELNEKNAKRYKNLSKQIENLTQQKNDISRRINTVTELSGLSVKIENFLKTELAPIKYSRAIQEASDNEIVAKNLKEIVNRVQDWCEEMSKYLPTKNYIEVEADYNE